MDDASPEPPSVWRTRVVRGYSSESQRRHYLEAASGGLTAAEATLIDRLVCAGSRVLVVGSGGGRELNALGARGIRPVGIELVRDVVERYSAATPGASRSPALISDMSDLPFRDASFDAVLLFNQVLEHGPTRMHRQRALREALRASRDGVAIVSLYVGAVEDWSVLQYIWSRSVRRSAPVRAGGTVDRTATRPRRPARKLLAWARGKTYRIRRAIGLRGSDVGVVPSGERSRAAGASVPVHLYRFNEFAEDVRSAGGVVVSWESATELALRRRAPPIVRSLDHLYYATIAEEGSRFTGTETGPRD
jgi:SAM-dependent methyltransferase